MLLLTDEKVEQVFRKYGEGIKSQCNKLEEVEQRLNSEMITTSKTSDILDKYVIPQESVDSMSEDSTDGTWRKIGVVAAVVVVGGLLACVNSVAN